MAFPTILVHVDNGARAGERIRLASELAARADGHLIGAAATGVSRFLYHSMPAEQNDPTLALHLDFLREQARTALAAFSAQCADLRHGAYEARVIDDEAGAGISLLARAADLIVLGQAEPQAKANLADLPVHVVTNSGRPVLIVPFAGHHATVGRRILVSWDGGREAARALQLALPLCKDADSITIAVFEVAADEHKAADALVADPRPWLARHGVKAALAVHALDHQRRLNRRHEVGERLLSLAADTGADLLVMGAYGHSRFRESILGGVTKTVMEAMTLPVLMAH
ncbi:universal stress protein [Massilia sp. TSP1-1-2]|uniref:universal stress protein n=1 Tax=unclassified Massilia TaxID=2609279 RepID=UPI003CF23656